MGVRGSNEASNGGVLEVYLGCLWAKIPKFRLVYLGILGSNGNIRDNQGVFPSPVSGDIALITTKFRLGSIEVHQES